MGVYGLGVSRPTDGDAMNGSSYSSFGHFAVILRTFSLSYGTSSFSDVPVSFSIIFKLSTVIRFNTLVPGSMFKSITSFRPQKDYNYRYTNVPDFAWRTLYFRNADLVPNKRTWRRSPRGAYNSPHLTDIREWHPVSTFISLVLRDVCLSRPYNASDFKYPSKSIKP